MTIIQRDSGRFEVVQTIEDQDLHFGIFDDIDQATLADISLNLLLRGFENEEYEQYRDQLIAA